MNKKAHLFFTVILMLLSWNQTYSATAPERAQLAVWATEAVIATYTYDYKNYLVEQKEIAKYFSANGWIAYTKALNDAQLPEAVQKNKYYVSAVATNPPVLTFLDPTHWQATMTILVIYSNPQYEQRQHLNVVVSFAKAPAGQGIRGFSIDNLKTKLTTPPCQCPIENHKPNSLTGTIQSPQGEDNLNDTSQNK